MKEYIKNISIILIISMILLTLTGCGSKDKNEDMLNKKVKEELSFLDLEIVGLINSLNNISIENYMISVKEANLR